MTKSKVTGHIYQRTVVKNWGTDNEVSYGVMEGVVRGIDGEVGVSKKQYLHANVSQDFAGELYQRMEDSTKSGKEAVKEILSAISGMKLTVGIKVTAVVGRAVVFAFVTTDETGREIANMGEVSMTAGETATVGPLDKGLTMTWEVE